MKKDLFDELLKSVKQGGEILQGTKKPSRQFNLQNPNVLKVRKKLGLSQAQFSKLLGISVATLRNWEQGRRKPDGPARVLIGIAATHPEVFPEVVGL
jgi:putative transcriptional regulator